MSRRRALRFWLFVVLAGCHTESVTDSAPACVPVDVAGTWDVRWVADAGGQIPRDDATRVWTIDQNGCDVTIRADPSDPANGATGSARDGLVYAEWTWYEGCHGIRETIDAIVVVGTLRGTFYRAVWREVLPDCSPGGVCSAALTGSRRTHLASAQSASPFH